MLPGLPDDLAALEVLLLETAEQQTDVVAGLTLVQGLVGTSRRP
jgi:hypothetical protein